MNVPTKIAPADVRSAFASMGIPTDNLERAEFDGLAITVTYWRVDANDHVVGTVAGMARETYDIAIRP